MKIDELRGMTARGASRATMSELAEELFNLRLQLATEPLDNPLRSPRSARRETWPAYKTS